MQRNENNNYIAEIPNWEGIKTFIMPNEFINRQFDKVQDHLEKLFEQRKMSNVYAENKYEYAKVHKSRR